MASFQKRGKTHRVIVRRKGQTITATFDSKAAAELWATQTEARLLGGESKRDVVHAKPPSTVTVAELFTRYADEISPTKRGGRWEIIRLKHICLNPIFVRAAATFTGPDMAEWRDERLKSVSGSSVNRELNLISAIFTRAIKEWRVGLAANPVHNIERPKSNKSRRQRVNPKEAQTIIKALGWDRRTRPTNPQHWTAYAFSLALLTAMRKGEIIGIRWRHVHLDKQFIHLPETKNGEPRDVPLSKAAIALVKMLKKGKPDDQLVPITSGYFDALLREARLSCGMMHIRMHDGRHEATTQIAKKVSNVLELGAITGHRDLAALRIYFNPKPGELADKLG